MIYGIILGIVFVVLAIAAGVFAAYQFDGGNGGLGATGVIACIVFAILFITIPFSFKTVDTGEIAVVKHLGKAKEVREPGMHYDFWMTNSYIRYDAKVQNVDIATAAYSSDAQTMEVAMTLQYQIRVDKVLEIAKEYGTLEVLQSRIQSIAIEKAKSVLSSYKAMDIISQRATMSPIVEQAIKEAVGDKYFVEVSAVVMTNIDFSDSFEKAVEDKMIAEQNQLKAEYENTAKIAAAEAEKQATIKKQEAKAEADKLSAQAEIEIAKSKAEAIRVQAEAEAKALGIQALEVARMLGLTEFKDKTDENGNTVSTEQIKENLTIEEAQLISDYVEYIKYLEVWDGKLPGVVTDGSFTVVQP